MPGRRVSKTKWSASACAASSHKVSNAIVGYALPIRRLGKKRKLLGEEAFVLRDDELLLSVSRRFARWDCGCHSIPCRESDPDDILPINKLDPFAATRAARGGGGSMIDPRPAGLRSAAHGVHNTAWQSRVGAGEAGSSSRDRDGHPSRGQSAAGVVRSALCVGYIHAVMCLVHLHAAPSEEL